MDDIHVVLVEPDLRLSQLVTLYLARHRIRVTTLHDPATLARELDRRSYTCVLWIADIDIGVEMMEVCERAGVALLRMVRLSARQALACILALVGPAAEA